MKGGVLRTVRRGFVPAWVLVASAASVACGDRLELGYEDAGVPYDADCVPGTYSGTYMCNTTAGSIAQLSANGPITVTLVPAGARTLAVTPDASLNSTASGTTTTSELTGRLDCPSRVLSGSVAHIVFTSSTFDGEIAGTGQFSARYATEGGAPELVDGVLDPPSALESQCTWTARLE